MGGILPRLPGSHCRKDTTGRKSSHIPFLPFEVNIRRRLRDPIRSRKDLSPRSAPASTLAGKCKMVLPGVSCFWWGDRVGAFRAALLAEASLAPFGASQLQLQAWLRTTSAPCRGQTPWNHLKSLSTPCRPHDPGSKEIFHGLLGKDVVGHGLVGLGSHT